MASARFYVSPGPNAAEDDVDGVFPNRECQQVKAFLLRIFYPHRRDGEYAKIPHLGRAVSSIGRATDS